MKKQEIIEVLRELHKITGFRIALYSADYSEIAVFPQEQNELCRRIQTLKCEHEISAACDRESCQKALAEQKAHIYRCPYGFVIAASPLYSFGTLTGFLVMGQVFEDGCVPEKQRLCYGIGENAGELFDTVPILKPDMIDSYVKIMKVCAQYLTLSSAVPGERLTVGEIAKRFINERYTEKIGIKEICVEIGCSKSTLITSFKNNYGTTVNKYITDLRLNEARKMLAEGNMSIGEIAAAVGFADQSYFSKVFSARYGTAPSEFKNQGEGDD